MELKTLSSKLVERIYDTALAPDHWPDLLEALATILPMLKEEQKNLKKSEVSLDYDTPPNRTPVYDALLAHLNRAAQIRIRLNNEEQNACIQASVFEKLPSPAVLLSTTGEVKLLNDYAKAFLKTTRLMRIDSNRVLFPRPSKQRKFDQYITELRTASPDGKQLSIKLMDDSQSQPVIINLSRANDLYDLDGDILLLILSNDMKGTFDIVDFAEQYQLTKAETRVAYGLLNEKSLNELSDDHEVSIHTIRSQLKSIFQKTHCHRQGDLIKLILLSQPATFKTKNRSVVKQRSMDYNQQVKYANGRVLSFSDIGPKQGLPVITFPPTSGSRLQVHPDISVLFDLNIRLITVDRPGFGHSTYIDNYNLQCVTEYTEALADHLTLETFALLGFCGGTTHALAGSSMLGKRVLHTTLISSVTPYQSVDLFKGNKSSFFIDLATSMPQMLNPLLTLSVSMLMKEPDRYYAQLFPKLCESDKEALLKTDFNDNFLLALRECMRQGPKSFCEELVLLGSYWGIDFKQVDQPITFWHGKEDQYVPIHLIQKFSNEFENAELIEVEKHGHFVIYYQWFNILKDLKNKAEMNKQRTLIPR